MSRIRLRFILPIVHVAIGSALWLSYEFQNQLIDAGCGNSPCFDPRRMWDGSPDPAIAAFFVLNFPAVLLAAPFDWLLLHIVKSQIAVHITVNGISVGWLWFLAGRELDRWRGIVAPVRYKSLSLPRVLMYTTVRVLFGLCGLLGLLTLVMMPFNHQTHNLAAGLGMAIWSPLLVGYFARRLYPPKPDKVMTGA